MQIQFDLRPYLHPFDARTTNPLLVLVGPPGQIAISTPQQSLQLPAGTYEFIIASGLVGDFTFAVTPAGTIDYDPAFDSFLSGRGTGTLVVNGFPINFDARYITGLTSFFVLPDAVPILNTTIRLLPGSAYVFEQGSGSVATVRLKIGLDGNVHYDPSLDIAQNGFLGGNATPSVQIFGYPLLVDARASRAQSVTLVPTGSLTGSVTDVTFANLLPTDNVALQLDSKRVPFVLDSNGTFHAAPNLAHFVRFDHFHGLARLTVLRPVL